MRGRYYNRAGVALTHDEWVLLQYDAYMRVAWDVVATGIEISTVWIGVNTSAVGPPIIFETMIFGGEHDHWQWRYSTEEEALAGHRAACELEGLVLVESE